MPAPTHAIPLYTCHAMQIVHTNLAKFGYHAYQGIVRRFGKVMCTTTSWGALGV